MNPPRFDHEKLNVYHEALGFVGLATDLLEGVPKSIAVPNQLDRASTAIPLNIAEGSGKFTPPDRCRFFDTVRGSALECAACLDVPVVKRILRPDDIVEAKRILVSVVSMLVGLIKAVAPGRVYEEHAAYGSDPRAE